MSVILHHDLHVHLAALHGIIYLVLLVVLEVATGSALVVLVVVEQHHFFVLVVAGAVVAPGPLLLLLIVLLLAAAILHSVFLQLLQLVRVCCAYELALHIKDLALWIHEELSVIALNLNAAHDDIVLHVDADLLVGGLPSVGICLPRLAIEPAVTVFHEAVVIQSSLRVIVIVVVASTCQAIRLVLHVQRSR